MPTRVIPWLRGPHDPLPDTRRALPPGSEAPGPARRRRRADAAAPGRGLLARASSPGTARASRCCGGRPTRAWCCSSTSSGSRARCARRSRSFIRTPGCEIRIDSAFRRVITACAGTPRDGQDGTWIVPEMVEAYCAWHRARHGAQLRDLDRRRAGRRPVRRQPGPHVLRRVDVLAPHRCLEDRAGRAGVLLPRARHRR